MIKFQPFENETQSISIGELTIENRLDQLEIYGALAITRDQAGLQLAQEMQALLNETVRILQAQTDLPEKITLRSDEKVTNPFR